MRNVRMDGLWLFSAECRFFEHLVMQLLVAMGYGGSIEDAGKALGKRGDEGIGIIKEDRFGLDVIYEADDRAWRRRYTRRRLRVEACRF